jgi:hypothetical protein
MVAEHLPLTQITLLTSHSSYSSSSAGNKLQQALFIGLLYPTASPFKKQQWTILNNFISLLGYYAAAWWVTLFHVTLVTNWQVTLHAEASHHGFGLQ